MSCRATGSYCYPGSGIHQNLGTGCGISFACLSGIRKQTGKGSVWCPGGGGGEVLPYMGYISCCKGYGFQAVYPGIGYITLAEDFGLD